MDSSENKQDIIMLEENSDQEQQTKKDEKAAKSNSKSAPSTPSNEKKQPKNNQLVEASAEKLLKQQQKLELAKKRQEENIKEQMVQEAMVIINSVNFLENKINLLLEKLEIEENKENDCDYKKIDQIAEQIRWLIKKINLEKKNIDIFMEKYGEIIKIQK